MTRSPDGGHVVENLEEGAVGPLLARVGRLDVVLDGREGGTGTVLELRDGRDDTCLVHDGMCLLCLRASEQLDGKEESGPGRGIPLVRLNVSPTMKNTRK